MMKCKEINKKLIFYIEDSIDETEKSEIEKHLSECKSCAADLSILKLSFQSIEIETQTEGNSFVSTQILAKIESKKQKKSVLKYVFQPVIATLVVFVGIWIGQNISNNYFNNQSDIVQNQNNIELSEQYVIDNVSYEEYYFVANQ